MNLNKVKKLNRTSLIFSLVLLVLVALMAVVILSVTSSGQNTKTNHSKLSYNNPNQIVNQVAYKVKGLIDSTIFDQPALSQIPETGFRATNANLDVSLPLTYSFSLSSANSSVQSNIYSPVVNKVQSYFNTIGFKSSTTSSIASLNNNEFFEGKYVVCQMVNYLDLTFTCASRQTLVQIANADLDFASLYDSASGNDSLTVLSSQIVNSATPGYKIAYFEFLSDAGQTKVLYYRVAENPWNMVNLSWYNDPDQDGNVMPNCGDFESVSAISSAFAGVQCYNSSSRSISTVSL
jgi:hypothetical protein